MGVLIEIGSTRWAKILLTLDVSGADSSGLYCGKE